MTTTRERRHQLYQALEAHKFDLEITRGFSARDPEVLDRRIEAVQLLLESLSQALELEPPDSPAVQTGQSRRGISHPGDTQMDLGVF
jgi:hypothetical protein